MANTLQNFYYDNLDEFNLNYSEKSEKHLRFFQWNIRGMNDIKKFDSILEFLDLCEVRLDILVIGEIWLKAENTLLYEISGYQSIFSCRNSSSGGLAIYISKHIQFRNISSEVYNGLHHIHIELKSHEKLYDVHAVYRPPSFDVNCFLDKVEEWVSSSNPSHPCFILGDVNIPMNLIQNNVVIRYKTLIESYAMLCTNTFETRPSSNNLLDHVVCRQDDLNRLRNDSIFSDVSDHIPVISTLKEYTGKIQLL